MSDLEFYFPALGSFLIAGASALVAYLVYRIVKGAWKGEDRNAKKEDVP